MKANILLGLLLICFAASCIGDSVDESQDQDSEVDISEILQKSVSPSQHPSLPSQTTFYQFARVTGYTHHFYDAGGRLLLEIGINPQKDTTGFTTFQFTDQGKLHSKTAYGLSSVTEFEYHYDNSGNLLQILQNGNNLESYEYDLSGQISRITLGRPPLQEQYMFEYDELGRISRQIYTTKPQTDPALRDWHFQYDKNDLLIFKSIPVSVSEKRPMFEYKYDSQKRLVEEIEYYPEYNFDPWLGKTYHYGPIVGF